MRYYLINKAAAIEAGLYHACGTHRTTEEDVLVRESEIDGHDTEALNAREISTDEITNLINKEELK